MPDPLAGLQIFIEHPARAHAAVHEAIRQAVSDYYQPVARHADSLAFDRNSLRWIALYNESEFRPCCMGDLNKFAKTPMGQALYYGATAGTMLWPFFQYVMH